jgi:hypothetical protein
MQSQKLKLLKKLLLSSSVFFLLSCSDPPDKPVCTPFTAIEWPVFRELFYKLCGDDAICRQDLPKWRDEVSHWTKPSDHGTCVTVLSGKVTRVSRLSPYVDDGGAKISWTDLYETSLGMPAKISWAPFKTWIQENCHDSKKCSHGVGNWESTVKTIDSQITGSK